MPVSSDRPGYGRKANTDSGMTVRMRVMMQPVRLTHDAEADAAYIYLVDQIDRGEVASSRIADIPLDRAALTVDFDTSGRVLGIEVLGASRVLREETISAAEDITRR